MRDQLYRAEEPRSYTLGDERITDRFVIIIPNGHIAAWARAIKTRPGFVSSSDNATGSRARRLSWRSDHLEGEHGFMFPVRGVRWGRGPSIV